MEGESTAPTPATKTLLRFADFFAQSQLGTKIVDPTEAEPFHSLLVQFPSMGLESSSMTLQVTYLPFQAQGIGASVEVFQVYTELENQLVPALTTEVLAYLAGINPNLTLGAFGVLGGDTVYFKHNLILSSDSDIRAVLDLTSGLILQSMQLFAGRIRDVARGRKSAARALAEPITPSAI